MQPASGRNAFYSSKILNTITIENLFQALTSVDWLSATMIVICGLTAFFDLSSARREGNTYKNLDKGNNRTCNRLVELYQTMKR